MTTATDQNGKVSIQRIVSNLTGLQLKCLFVDLFVPNDRDFNIVERWGLGEKVKGANGLLSKHDFLSKTVYCGEMKRSVQEKYQQPQIRPAYSILYVSSWKFGYRYNDLRRLLEGICNVKSLQPTRFTSAFIVNVWVNSSYIPYEAAVVN